MRKIIPILLLVLQSVQLLAVKATPEPIKVIQPDGSELIIRLRGDEFFKYTTTIDGFLIKKNEKGIYNYATFDKNGIISVTDQKVSNIDQRSASEQTFLKTIDKNIPLNRISLANRVRKVSNLNTQIAENTFPVTGSPRSLVILVNFADKSFVTANPKTAFTNLLNQSGYSTNGGTGSARDYFIESSFGQFTPQFDVVGPVILPQNIAYYGNNDFNGDDLNPQQMVIDACAAADAVGVDFKQYDLDNNDIVDNIFIYYAGNNEAEGANSSTIWPHRWSLTDYNSKFDGKSVFDYACTSELKSSSGTSMCGIGTFCHEFGHVLGLVDYYPTNQKTHYTLEDWNIMDAGAYLNDGRTPPTYSAYDRFYIGWLIPEELLTPQNVILGSLLSTNKAYLVSENGNHNLDGKNPNPVEFFLFENRQKTGWDAYLPNSGLLITRIYYNSSDWFDNGPNNDPSNMGVDIIEADGKANNYTMSGDTYPGSNSITTFNPKLRNGTTINKPLTEIAEDSEIITFKFLGGETDTNIDGLKYFVQNNGTLIIYSSVKQQTLNIYNISGSLIKSIYAPQNFVVVKGLSRKSVYILKLGNIIDKIIIN